MKNRILITVGILIVIGFTFLLSCKTESEHKTKFFEARKEAWIIKGDSEWQFSENTIIGIADSTVGYVVTKKKYQNFELILEFKPDSTINSGVFIRCPEPKMSPINCHELNIWDLHPNQDFRTGAIVAKVKPYKYVETLNVWNTYRVIADKENIEVYVNDTQTATIKKDTLANGYIGLQAGGNGRIEFRNVRLKEL